MCVLCDLRTRAVYDGTEEPERLGYAAFAAHLTGRTDIATVVLGMVFREFGREAMFAITGGWCDIALGWIPGYERGAPVYLTWQNIITGRITHAEDTPPIDRWAGQMLAARAAGDEETRRALFDAMPADESGTAQYLGALLQALSFQVLALNSGGAA